MICDKKKCTGCFACYNACLKGAIKMLEDKDGCIYPEIDEKKCVNCGLCKKVCPSLNQIQYNKPIKCYAAYSKIENIRKESTSGGVATTISKEILKEGGIVYGASFGENCTINHIRVTDVNKLEQLQGSKYVHSYINDIYTKVKKDLKDFPQKKILFIGTPCQIAGLKKYLGKEYENLILMDIICHGVPPQQYLKEEIYRIINDLNVDRINFRDGNNYGLYIKKDKKIIFKSERSESPYCDGFFNTLTLRENCYDCKYAGSNRISDITIGDFWGLKKESDFYEDKEKGVSVVILSTIKGLEFFKKYCKELQIEERAYEEAIIGNTQLRKPAPKNKNADKFKKYYIKHGFYKAYLKSTRITRLKRSIKKIVKR